MMFCSVIDMWSLPFFERGCGQILMSYIDKVISGGWRSKVILSKKCWLALPSVHRKARSSKVRLWVAEQSMHWCF